MHLICYFILNNFHQKASIFFSTNFRTKMICGGIAMQLSPMISNEQKRPCKIRIGNSRTQRHKKFLHLEAGTAGKFGTYFRLCIKQSLHKKYQRGTSHKQTNFFNLGSLFCARLRVKKIQKKSVFSIEKT